MVLPLLLGALQAVLAAPGSAQPRVTPLGPGPARPAVPALAGASLDLPDPGSLYLEALPLPIEKPSAEVRDGPGLSALEDARRGRLSAQAAGAPTLGALSDDGKGEGPEGLRVREAVARSLASMARGPPGPSTPDLLRRIAEPGLRAAIESKIYTDPLTGMLRRSWVEDHVEELLRLDASLILSDLDHFKKGVNDAFGHDVGDIAISGMAELAGREAPEGRVAVRWGGEEMLLIDPGTREEAVASAERLRGKAEAELAPLVVQRARENLGRRVRLERLTVSMGVAPLRKGQGPPHADFVASLDQADRNLYAAKNGGRNRVEAAPPVAWPGRSGLSDWGDRLAHAARAFLAFARGKGPSEKTQTFGGLRWASHKPRAGNAPQLLADVEDEELKEQLSGRLYTDALTGAFNRAHLNDHLPSLGSRPGTLLAFDVDFFKRINDRHGHNKGDEVLRGLTAILQALGGPHVYRMGGEEFLVWTDRPPLEAVRTAEGIRKAVEAELGKAVGLGRVTVSVGLAGFEPGEETQKAFQRALTRADQALYRSKTTGRNRLTLATPGLEGAPLPGGGRAVLEGSKFVQYLLNPLHPKGRDKAAWFERALGYTLKDWEVLRALFREAAAGNPVSESRYAEQGALEAHVLVRVPGRGAKAGKTYTVRTVWHLRPGESVPRFITALPFRKPFPLP